MSAGRVIDLEGLFVEIPSGRFAMGGESEADHQPIHDVEISAFRLTRSHVTNEQYAVFCEATDHHLPEFWGQGRFRSGQDFPDHPVIGVSWLDASAFSEWVGGRLVTEVEWEYAARGGLEGKAYPFGDEIDPTRANYVQTGTAPMGSYALNGFGLYDICGNVVERVADHYDSAWCARSPKVDPQGLNVEKRHVIRGGGWHSGPYCNRVDFRNALPANWADFAVGFRIAAEVG